MKAKLIKVIEIKGSANGAGRCYLLCFKGADGKSYKTYTDSNLGNFSRWYNAIIALTDCGRTGDELWLSGLNEKGKALIDADSLFAMERVKAQAQPFIPDHEAVTKPETERKDLA